jgi:hypothetical protein
MSWIFYWLEDKYYFLDKVFMQIFPCFIQILNIAVFLFKEVILTILFTYFYRFEVQYTSI